MWASWACGYGQEANAHLVSRDMIAKCGQEMQSQRGEASKFWARRWDTQTSWPPRQAGAWTRRKVSGESVRSTRSSVRMATPQFLRCPESQSPATCAATEHIRTLCQVPRRCGLGVLLQLAPGPPQRRRACESSSDRSSTLGRSWITERGAHSTSSISGRMGRQRSSAGRQDATHLRAVSERRCGDRASRTVHPGAACGRRSAGQRGLHGPARMGTAGASAGAAAAAGGRRARRGRVATRLAVSCEFGSGTTFSRTPCAAFL